MTPLQPDMASDEEVLPGEMTAMDGGAEMLVDEPTEPEQLTGFEEHTTRVRDLSRKDVEAAKESGAEDLHHNSPGPKTQTTAEERDPNAQDPREDMTEPKGEATPSQDQIMAQERRPGTQNEGEDLTVSKPDAMPSRTQAAWVTEAVAAVQANKKVRFRIMSVHDMY